jgi:hypothetical protein
MRGGNHGGPAVAPVATRRSPSPRFPGPLAAHIGTARALPPLLLETRCRFCAAVDEALSSTAPPLLPASRVGPPPPPEAYELAEQLEQRAGSVLRAELGAALSARRRMGAGETRDHGSGSGSTDWALVRLRALIAVLDEQRCVLALLLGQTTAATAATASRRAAQGAAKAAAAREEQLVAARELADVERSRCAEELQAVVEDVALGASTAAVSAARLTSRMEERGQLEGTLQVLSEAARAAAAALAAHREQGLRVSRERLARAEAWEREAWEVARAAVEAEWVGRQLRARRRLVRAASRLESQPPPLPAAI